jgi:CubicO group peptidase (beta-lactamase class C family)
MKTRIVSLGLLLFALVLIAPACKKDKDICSPTFNLEKFEENLIDELDGDVMGYAYVVTNKGTVAAQGAGGFARAGTDGVKPMSVHERMQVASVSKSITTTATLAVLQDRGVNVNSSVAPYLPSTWALGPGFANVTFFELLNHSPGMNMVGTQGFNASRFDSLRTYVQQGATLPKTRTYSNTHHGLMRVILPSLWGASSPTGEPGEAFFANAFRQCVQTYIFDKLDIPNAGFVAPAVDPLLAYSGPNDNSGLGGTADFTLVSGGTGWNISCWEAAKYWAYLWNSEDLINKTNRDLMRTNELGLWNSITGKYGRYYNKLGGWNFGGPEAGGNWVNSIVMEYPNGYQVTIFTNSPGSKGLVAVSRDAFENAYGCF